MVVDGETRAVLVTLAFELARSLVAGAESPILEPSEQQRHEAPGERIEAQS
jgi:hypothetical protein